MHWIHTASESPPPRRAARGGAGRVLESKDANGVATRYTHHPRDWLASRIVKGRASVDAPDDAATGFLCEAKGIDPKHRRAEYLGPARPWPIQPPQIQPPQMHTSGRRQPQCTGPVRIRCSRPSGESQRSEEVFTQPITTSGNCLISIR